MVGKRFSLKGAWLYRPLCLWLLILLPAVCGLQAQTYTDGPIQLQVKVRDVKNFFDATDQGIFGIGLKPDELRYNIWATDNANVSSLAWQGGICLQWNGNPSVGGTTTTPFNYLMFSYIYPTNSVPKFFDIRMNGWEDDSPDSFLGVGCGGSDCNFESAYCCGTVPIFGGCIITEGDDEQCFALPFKANMDYRLGPPCQWYDHGYVNMAPGACSNDVYKPFIQSYWRYTKGTGCANPIPLGPFAAGSSILHYNSNECYNNNYAASPGNDVFYSFTTASPIGINANLCGPNGAQFNSVLYLLDANCNQMNMNDDGCGSQSTISTYLCQPGTYFLVVDGATAADQGTFTLTLQEDPTFTFTASITKTDVDCFGANDGKAVLHVSGGVPYTTGAPYTYLWSNGSTVDSAVNLPPGLVTVAITDSRGCTKSASATITQPTQLTATASVDQAVTCSGYNNGIVTAHPSGGTPPYRYFWNGTPIQVTQTATNLPAGTIAYTVADNNNCIFSSTVTIGTSTVINIVPGTWGNVTCFGAADGFINLSANGGLPPYSYVWSNGPTTPNISGLAPGPYTLIVTDQNSCSVTYTQNITEPPKLTVAINDTANARCNGGSDGAITIVALGGTQPYTYLWSNGATTQDLLNVHAGTYTVTVKDANACTATLSHTLTEPSAINLAFATVAPTCYGGSTGSIDLTVTGGTTPYKYLWTNNAITEDVSGLPSGMYGILVTDSNNCFKFDFRSLTDPSKVALQYTVSHVSCNGANTGTINITPSGGAGGYTYAWTPASATGSNPTSLAAGFYSVTVSDQSGCKDSLLNIIVNQPDALGASVVKVDSVSCHGLSNGAINISVTGGVQPFTFAWSNGATTQDLIDITAGNYSVVITDGNNCTNTSLSNIAVGEPTTLTVALSGTNPACFGVPNGAVNSTPAGGTSPYTYAWNTGANTQNIQGLNGGQYSLLLTDAKGCTVFDTITIRPATAIGITGSITNLICNGQANGQIALHLTGGTPNYSFNWSSGNPADSVLSGIGGGLYWVTVTDAQGCRAVDTFTVNEPAPIVLELGSTDVLCFGDGNGVAFLKQLTGGTAPYTYNWSNGQTTAYATGLDPLTYSLIITDANNCTATQSVTVKGPALLVSTIDAVTNNQCFSDTNGSVSISAVGGTQPYQFSVQNNQSQASGSFDHLAAGNYTAVVLDANNCRTTNSFTVTQPDDWSVKFKDPYVFITRGSFTPLKPILVDTTPGMTFTFAWDPVDGLDCPACRNPKTSPVATTTYTVTVTDANGCTHTAQIVVVAKDEYEVFYPNVFSPNGDGNNDTWSPIDFGSTETIHIEIYDRWGELVYQTDDINKPWDGSFSGKALPPDTYAYFIKGTLKNKKDFKKSGSITLMK